MVSLWMLRYYTTQGGYSIGFPANHYWGSNPRGWDLHFWRASSPVWNRFKALSHRWHSWRSLPLGAFLPPRLLHGLISVLHAREVVLSVSPTGSGVQNLISGAGTTSVSHLQCRERHWAPKSPTLQRYSPMRWTVATALKPSQSPICKALPLQWRWKYFQESFYLRTVLLEYQHPKPISSQWTRKPKPGAPET